VSGALFGPSSLTSVYCLSSGLTSVALQPFALQVVPFVWPPLFVVAARFVMEISQTLQLKH